MQYVGQTGRTIKERFREHIYKIKNGGRYNSFIYRHFKLDGHGLDNLAVQIVFLLIEILHPILKLKLDVLLNIIGLNDYKHLIH